jgi:hypothetical protein
MSARHDAGLTDFIQLEVPLTIDLIQRAMGHTDASLKL